MKTLKYSLFFCMLLNVTQLMAQPGSYRRILVTASRDSVQQWQRQEILPAHFHYEKGVLEMELDTAELEMFKLKGIAYNDISDSFYRQTQRMTAVQEAPANFSYGSMGGYYTYTEAMAVLDDMRTKFPSLISAKDTIGFTHEGRPIIAMRISDNAGVQENDEDEWLITGLHHANEVMGTHIVMYFAWYLLEHYESDKEIRTLLNNSALYIVPVVNPDGLVWNESINPSGGGSWRKNRKPRVISATTHYGVDLNRNYGYNRAYTHPGILGQAGSSFAGNDYYRGTAAWSEAETQAIRDLCNQHQFTAAFNYHAWDDSFNYPWNFDVDSLTDDSVKYKAITQYCNAETQFETGTFNKTLGYSANGTSDDWLYGEQTTKNKIFAFTIEVGKSFYPAQHLIIPYCDSLLHANLKMLRMAAKYAPAQETSDDTVRTLTHYVSYNIKRYSIKDTNFTVSITPLDPVVTGTDASKLYTDLSFLQTRADTISYSLSPAIANGTIIRFLLTVDNGMWSVTDTISKVYWGHSTLPLGCTDHYEPNNSVSRATLLLPGQPVKGMIEEGGDEDWFYFENTAGKQNIRVVLSELPADFDIELTDPAGQRVAAAARPYKLNDTIVYNNTSTGVYRVRVYGYEKVNHPFRCYRLAVELAGAPFELTGYTSFKEKSNEEISFSVYPVPATSTVSVAVNARVAQNISWSITDHTGRKLSTGQQRINSGLAVFPLTINHLPRGVYLVNIILKSGNVLSAKIVKE